MRADVLYRVPDGTLRLDQFEAPHITSQLWGSGKGAVFLRDEGWREIGWAFYAGAVRIRGGVALEGEEPTRG